MLSRLFLILTLLLVGITTVAIGAPVAKTNKIIKPIKFPQVGSGNLTLNRRFMTGLPGLPQCTNPNYPLLVYSECATIKIISATCDFIGNLHGAIEIQTPCPDKTLCKEFKSVDPSGSLPRYLLNFAICVDEEDIDKFDNDHRDGVFCKTYVFDGNTGGQATLSFNIVDGTQKQVQVKNARFKTGDQSGSRQNTHNLSSIVDVKGSGQTIEVCMETYIGGGLLVQGMFSYLDGTYGADPGS